VQQPHTSALRLHPSRLRRLPSNADIDRADSSPSIVWQAVPEGNRGPSRVGALEAFETTTFTEASVIRRVIYRRITGRSGFPSAGAHCIVALCRRYVVS
jgi:hypothetical protein